MMEFTTKCSSFKVLVSAEQRSVVKVP